MKLEDVSLRDDRLTATGRPEAGAQTRAGISALYETHFERVARYIYARIGDPDEAEDLASEVFTRALQSSGTYKETGVPLEAWIFRIAHNLAVDHLRRKSRRPASVSIDDVAPVSGKNNPAEEVERMQAMEEVRAALTALSESQRQVLVLRFASELSSEEVAAVMGKKPGAVREMQSAAIKKLRVVLGKR